MVLSSIFLFSLKVYVIIPSESIPIYPEKIVRYDFFGIIVTLE